ncbi:DUF2474 family protein [Rhizobium leguminosarum]|nr:DUF2474 family protein [Rhizobium leguminosarum]MBY5538252.1 DUF2474 family protein [Rhizobium leguminosarum]
MSARVTGAWRRISWLVAIWSLSVAALGLFAAAFRILMSAAGLMT